MSEQNLDPREIDKVIAALRYLKVLGEAPATWWGNPRTWSVSSGEGEMQPVYLHNCTCGGRPKYHLGHFASCLKVVPFYSKFDDVATAALQQVCDERGLEALCDYKDGWRVTLGNADRKRVTSTTDPSLAIAICKALEELK